MRVVPINGHIIIRPIEEKTAFLSSQATFEERGEIIDAPLWIKWFTSIKVGRYCFFDSWTAAKYLDSEKKEFWLVPRKHIKGIEI